MVYDAFRKLRGVDRAVLGVKNVKFIPVSKLKHVVANQYC